MEKDEEVIYPHQEEVEWQNCCPDEVESLVSHRQHQSHSCRHGYCKLWHRPAHSSHNLEIFTENASVR